MLKEFLFEIGTEELPAGFLEYIGKEFKGLAEGVFKAHRIKSGDIKLYYTPRRITLYSDAMEDRQWEEMREVVGPPVKAGFDRKGKPTEAAMGFARANKHTVADLKVKQTEKGEYLCIIEEMERADTLAILPEILTEAVSVIHAQKTMRWDNSSLRFTRPVRWLLALYGDRPVNFTLGSVKTAQYTYGHRIYGNRQIPVTGFESYVNGLRAHDVIIDPKEREDMIAAGIRQICSEISADGAFSPVDRELLAEAVNSTEYPTLLYGNFSEKYLKLPSDVLITSMKKHQGFFSLSCNNSMLPGFISVVNLKTGNPGVIKKGNERVLKSRLEDARFFFSEDLKMTLESRLEELHKVLFLKKLGTLYDKTRRIEKAVALVGRLAGLGGQETELVRAATLSKTDLLTEMVGEFPELQGVMGRVYALQNGERASVASAIGEQYLPRFFGDALPKTKPGAVLSIADKMDTIGGCFGAGLIPSGSQDPYGLRRQGLGIVQILVSQQLDITFEQLIDISLSILSGAIEHDKKGVTDLLLAFLKARLDYYLENEGIGYDIINSVTAVHHSPYRALLASRALAEAAKDEDFRHLFLSIRRVCNIIPKDRDCRFSPAGLAEEEEKVLYAAAEKAKSKAESLILSGDFTSAVNAVSAINHPISVFFDKVLVMCEDKALRENRLGLLQYIYRIFIQIADFSHIVMKG